MTVPDPLAALPPILARKLANLPPQQLHQILQTKEGPK